MAPATSRADTHADDERVGRFLVDRASRSAGTRGGPCPDDNDLAGFAEGRLPDAKRTAVLAHVADCDACTAVVSAVASEGDAAGSDRTSGRPGASVVSLDDARRRRTFRWVLIAAAAAAAGVVAVIGVRFGGHEAPASPDQQVASAADVLRGARPDLFEGFQALSAAELSSPGNADAARGGLVLHTPTGSTLGAKKTAKGMEAKPVFSWTAVPGAPSYAVTLYDASGRALWVRTTPSASLAMPPDVSPLVPGAAYAWSISADGPLGSVEGRRAFTVVSADESKRFDAALHEIAARAPESIRSLVAAQLAIRRGYLEEAERLIGDQRRAADSALARDTEQHVRRRLGRDVDVSAPR
jgi:hypothetical protein